MAVSKNPSLPAGGEGFFRARVWTGKVVCRVEISEASEVSMRLRVSTRHGGKAEPVFIPKPGLQNKGREKARAEYEYHPPKPRSKIERKWGGVYIGKRKIL